MEGRSEMLAQQVKAEPNLLVLLLPLILYAVAIVGWWRIVSKAGYTGAWALIALVPLVNLVFFFIFAFSDWPILKTLRAAQSAGIPPTPPLA
jgi:hypothetical protein